MAASLDAPTWWVKSRLKMAQNDSRVKSLVYSSPMNLEKNLNHKYHNSGPCNTWWTSTGYPPKFNFSPRWCPANTSTLWRIMLGHMVRFQRSETLDLQSSLHLPMFTWAVFWVRHVSQIWANNMLTFTGLMKLVVNLCRRHFWLRIIPQRTCRTNMKDRLMSCIAKDKVYSYAPWIYVSLLWVLSNQIESNLSIALHIWHIANIVVLP